MPSRHKDLEGQVASLQSELEYSAFLNKGVLQTNIELKLRIVELEKENALLQTAESQLARMEDRLETAERKLKDRTKRLEVVEKEWEREMQREVEKREEVEGERDSLRVEVERLRTGWEAVKKVFVTVDGAVRKQAKEDAHVTPSMPRAVSGTARGSSSASRAATVNAKAGPSTTRKVALRRGSPGSRLRRVDDAAEVSSSPVRTSRAAARKRRRVHESIDDEELEKGPIGDSEYDKTPQPSPPPAQLAPTPPRTHPLTSSTHAKRRDSLLIAKRRELKRSPPDFEVKIEPNSPRKMRSAVDSDDDPLAIF